LVDFASNIVALVALLPKNLVGRHIAAQILSSGTAAAANYAEARGAESRADFIHKMKFVQKELNENPRLAPNHWQEFLGFIGQIGRHSRGKHGIVPNRNGISTNGSRQEWRFRPLGRGLGIYGLRIDGLRNPSILNPSIPNPNPIRQECYTNFVTPRTDRRSRQLIERRYLDRRKSSIPA
jgi:hypothetical protein